MQSMKLLKERNCDPKNLYLAKLSFKYQCYRKIILSYENTENHLTINPYSVIY